MKTLAATTLILCAASLTALAASIDGTWISNECTLGFRPPELFRTAMRFKQQEICPMKTLAATTLILCAASLTALAASIDGTWISALSP